MAHHNHLMMRVSRSWSWSSDENWLFKGRGAIAKEGPVLQTKKTMAYMVRVGTTTLALFTYGTPERTGARWKSRHLLVLVPWLRGRGSTLSFSQSRRTQR